MRYEANFIKAINQCLGSKKGDITVFLADRNGQEPKDPYIMVSMLPHQNVGQGEVNHVATKQGLNQSVLDSRVIPFRLTLQSRATDSSQDLFNLLRIGIDKSSQFKYYFSQNGMAVQSVSTMVFSSEPVDTVQFRRMIFDVFVGVNTLSTFKIDTIEEVVLYDKNDNTRTTITRDWKEV